MSLQNLSYIDNKDDSFIITATQKELNYNLTDAIPDTSKSDQETKKAEANQLLKHSNLIKSNQYQEQEQELESKIKQNSNINKNINNNLKP